MIASRLEQFLNSRRNEGLYRQRRTINHKALNFSSNDYLSLMHDERIKHAYHEGLDHYPTGSGGSMVVCGYHPAHKMLETAFAQALGVEQCLLFSSGYAANLSIASFLQLLNVPILIDKGVHASIYDGLKLSTASFIRYRHNDVEDLALKLEAIKGEKVVITESIFSMSGQSAPLKKMAALCKTHQAHLIIDEAHAFGVLGNRGLGGIEAFNLSPEEAPLRVIPLGKACVSQGAVVAGGALWVDSLLQCARPYIYSTAMSPAMAPGILKTLEIIINAQERRKKIFLLIEHFNKAILKSKFKWRKSHTLIQQLQLGCPKHALFVAKKLQEKNIICLPMRTPTVSKKETGLRIILNFNHNVADIDQLMAALEEI